MFFVCKFNQITSELNPPKKITEKSSHSEPVLNEMHTKTEAETSKLETDKQSRKKTLQPMRSLPGVDNMEDNKQKTPSADKHGEQCINRP